MSDDTNDTDDTDRHTGIQVESVKVGEIVVDQSADSAYVHLADVEGGKKFNYYTIHIDVNGKPKYALDIEESTGHILGLSVEGLDSLSPSALSKAIKVGEKEDN